MYESNTDITGRIHETSVLPVIRPLRLPKGGSVSFPVMSRERILTDIAEAEFIEIAVGELMQLIHHVVMTSLKSSIDSCRLKDRQFERPFQIGASLPIWKRHEAVETGGCSWGRIKKLHRNGTAGKIIGTEISIGLDIEGADGFLLIVHAVNTEDWVDLRLGIRTIAQTYGGEVEVVGWPSSNWHR